MACLRRLYPDMQGPPDAKVESEPIRWDKEDFHEREAVHVTAVVGSKAKHLVPLLGLDGWDKWDGNDKGEPGFKCVRSPCC